MAQENGAARELARMIEIAAAETAAFNRGRDDFRRFGVGAANPFSPREGAHRLWSDGTMFERNALRDRERLGAS